MRASLEGIPSFGSWVIIAGISYELFTTEGGVINVALQDLFGIEPVNFLGSEFWFRPLIIFQHIWKESGWGTIIFLAALAGVDMEMYEAAKLDGATRWQQIIYITLPAIKTTVITMLILQLGKVMETGFDQIFLMQNSMNRTVSDVFDTYIYTKGIEGGQYSLSTAAGLFKSLVGMIMVIGANKLAKLFGESGRY